ncbi:unnamed protein product [Lactuca virosa]|uniref:Uncharacterized protein n=1 Tax=Lactuca virosa TaxID=75947 RepID=A0AAU9NDK2_9ASTR|nr:unnamed protein product [Lactuca virosa]
MSQKLDDSVDTLEDGDDSEPDYTPVEHPSEATLSPDYTSVVLELLTSDYETDEDEEDTATSPETSPPFPTPLNWSHRTLTGTLVKHTPRKVAATPSRKKVASPPASPPTAKKSCGDAVSMSQIQGTRGGYQITIRGGRVIHCTPTPDTLVEQAISLLVPYTVHHSDIIGVMDIKLFLLRMALIQLTERVK